MPRVSRQELIQKLESVEPGLSTRDIVEQSKCFVFQKGRLATYNDEVACQTPIKMPFEGALPAKKMLELLHRLNGEDIDLESRNGELLILDGKRKAGLRLEKEIQLPIDLVEKPKDWHKLHEEFNDAVDMVQECASGDEAEFRLTCIHLNLKCIEACDNFQMIRYKVRSGVSQPTLIKRDSIKHITALGMTEMAETDTWLHFRNPGGLILSCRRYLEEYLDLTPYLKVEGEKIAFPKTLGEAADRAQIFSSEKEDNLVQVRIKEGRVFVKGSGASGWYSEPKRIQYKGTPFRFTISPKLLMLLVERHNEFEITEGRLKVAGPNFTYVACLGMVEEENNA